MFKRNKNKIFKLCLIFNVLVEIIQLIPPARLFDIYYIMLNSLGEFIGLLLAIKFANYISDK